MPKVKPLGSTTNDPKRDPQRRDNMMGGEVEKWIRVIGLPKPELCKLMDIGLTTLHERIRNPGEFRVQELRIIADLAGIDVSQLVN